MIRWVMTASGEKTLVEQALRFAVLGRRSQADLLHHSGSAAKALFTLAQALIVTWIFWDAFMDHGEKLRRTEEVTYNLCFYDSLRKELQKLVGDHKAQTRFLTGKLNEKSDERSR